MVEGTKGSSTRTRRRLLQSAANRVCFAGCWPLPNGGPCVGLGLQLGLHSQNQDCIVLLQQGVC